MEMLLCEKSGKGLQGEQIDARKPLAECVGEMYKVRRCAVLVQCLGVAPLFDHHELVRVLLVAVQCVCRQPGSAQVAVTRRCRPAATASACPGRALMVAISVRAVVMVGSGGGIGTMFVYLCGKKNRLVIESLSSFF
ncbi:hypothetical protein [Ectopseudomonas guguanensis]|uniref:hypothetical protein n=1 Tax=Ectopseudomonas guguanensis TaxID=1198456 RepID=UPI003D02248F